MRSKRKRSTLYTVRRTSYFFFAVLMIFCTMTAQAQEAEALIKRVRERLEQVKDYKAAGKLKTDVPFIKIPESQVDVYYKRPDKFKITKPDGISIVPKGGISVNINSLFSAGEYALVPAGKAVVQGKQVVVVKMLPLKEENEVVLSTLYIDEKEALIYKSNTTTRSNGTYEMEMMYGKFAKWGLPDKVLFSFSTKDYKLPKGVTFEYEIEKKVTDATLKDQKGRVEITYRDYNINKGINDAVFTSK